MGPQELRHVGRPDGRLSERLAPAHSKRGLDRYSMTEHPQLERAVEVMDRLRSPGGCPWDAAQTHESLTRYLLEEAYEVIEAIETNDLALLREELGDLLLQVLFHSRISQELPPDQAFGIEDVADDLVDKLVRRHPHVFAGAD